MAHGTEQRGDWRLLASWLDFNFNELQLRQPHGHYDGELYRRARGALPFLSNLIRTLDLAWIQGLDLDFVVLGVFCVLLLLFLRALSSSPSLGRLILEPRIKN